MSDPLYGEVIEQFLFEEFPGIVVTEETRFEALSKAVFGSKQRRNGPLPKPEQQVEIREILRRNKHLHFFTAWGSRKQEPNVGFDILDYIALRQLYSLQDNIRKCGWDATFHFRLEDLTDLVLFGERSRHSIEEYGRKFSYFAAPLGPAVKESLLVKEEEFFATVERLTPVFLDVLDRKAPVSELHRLGWTGDLPTRQQDYYREMYRTFYPHTRPEVKMAQYFAIALARKLHSANALPEGEFIQISFVNPVPGDPIPRKRVNYRSVPERYTHIHKAPWLGKGYLKISEEGGETSVTPKIAAYGEQLPLHSNKVTLGSVDIECDYLLS